MKFDSVYRESWSIGRETVRQMLKLGNSRETQESWQAWCKYKHKQLEYANIHAFINYVWP